MQTKNGQHSLWEVRRPLPTWNAVHFLSGHGLLLKEDQMPHSSEHGLVPDIAAINLKII